jgi:membrane-associated phospholipid phosphatase
MRRRWVIYTLMSTLLCVVPRAWAATLPEPADHELSEVATVWFDTLYDVVKSEATAFPEAGRIYGISAVALYEAVVPGAPHHRSLVGQLRDLAAVPQPNASEPYHWPTVANAALARTIRGVFPSLTPESLDTINGLEQKFAAQFQAEVPPEDEARSAAHGHAVADAILAWTATDAFAVYNNCPYDPAPVPGAWRPTPPVFIQNPQQPCWGQLRPMVLTSGEECAPPGHSVFSTDPESVFSAAAFEVYETGLALTDAQRTIAEYWLDAPGMTGTSSGHWVAIVGQIARTDGLSLAAAAEAYAKVGIAVADVFITSFAAKYRYNLQRPVTYIQDHIDGSWLSYQVTPPNPAYLSGHATQSGAAATVLTALFGRKAFTDTLHTDHHLVPPQAPRTFRSFDEAAAEAAVSRLYAGIHFAFDSDDGLSTGRCVGETINARVRFTDEGGG